MDPDELNKGNTISPSPAISGLDDLPPIEKAEDDSFSPPPAPPVTDLPLPPLPTPDDSEADVSSGVTEEKPEPSHSGDESARQDPPTHEVSARQGKKINKKAIIGGVLALVLLVGAPLFALNVDKFRGDTRSSADDLSRAANYGKTETVTHWRNEDGVTSTATEQQDNGPTEWDEAQERAARAAAAQVAANKAAAVAEQTRMAAILKKSQADAAAAARLAATQAQADADAATAVGGGGKLASPVSINDPVKIEPRLTTAGTSTTGIADKEYQAYIAAYNQASGGGWTDAEKAKVDALAVIYYTAAEKKSLEDYEAWAEAANTSGSAKDMEYAMSLAERAADFSFQRQKLEAEMNIIGKETTYDNLLRQAAREEASSGGQLSDGTKAELEEAKEAMSKAILTLREVETEIRASDALNAYNNAVIKYIADNGTTESAAEEALKNSNQKNDLDAVMEDIYIVKEDIHDFVFKITDDDRKILVNDNPTRTNCSEGFINTSGACCAGTGRMELIFRYKDCIEKYNCNAGPVGCGIGSGPAAAANEAGFSSGGGGSSNEDDGGGSGCGADVCSDPHKLQVRCESDGTKEEQLCPGWACREEICGGTKYFCVGSGDNLSWSTNGGSCGFVGICVETKVYTMQSGQWVVTALDKVGDYAKVGDKVRFATRGNNVQFSKGRFKINGGSWITSTTKNTAGEYYVEHTLNQSGTYNVEGQVQ